MRRGIEPSVTPCLPSLLSSTQLPIHLLWLCLWLWKSFGFLKKEKKALTTHFNMTCTHTHSSWHKDWKNQLPQSTLLVWVEMPLELGFDHEGTLKLASVTHTVEFF